MSEKVKPRAIIVDDERHVRVLMKKLLGKMSCEVIGEATNGREAVDLFMRENPDMVLLDISMPTMSGEEALERIMDRSPDAFVVILSSIANTDSIERCISLGAATYVRKDTPLQEMMSIIADAWRTHKADLEAGE